MTYFYQYYTTNGIYCQYLEKESSENPEPSITLSNSKIYLSELSTIQCLS